MQRQAIKIARLEEELMETRHTVEVLQTIKPPYYAIPDDVHGEERLRILEKWVKEIMRDIEDIKRTGMDSWERFAEVDKWIKKKAEEIAKAKGISYKEALEEA